MNTLAFKNFDFISIFDCAFGIGECIVTTELETVVMFRLYVMFS